MALDGEGKYDWDDAAARGRYVGMAASYAPLGAVISGEATMRSSLDGILDGIEKDARLTKSESPHLAEFGECAAFLLSDLSDFGDNYLQDSLTGIMKDNAEALLNRKWNSLKGGVGAAVAAAGFVAWAIPPLDIPAYFLFLGGWIPYCAIKGQAKRGRRAKDHREEVFSSLYLRADILDRDIGRCFVMDDFLGCRERFEKTYQALDSEERADVGAGLHRMLSAGALDMGEAELDRYLSSLTVSEVAPDA